MAISVHCPFCNWSAEVSDELAGKKARCPQCREIVVVPPAAPPLPPPISAAAPADELSFLKVETAVSAANSKSSQNASRQIGPTVSLPTLITVATAIATIAFGGLIYWAFQAAKTQTPPPRVVATAPSQPPAPEKSQPPKPPLATSANVVLASVFKQAKPAIAEIKTYDKLGRPRGLGSGFLVDESGLLVTNFHVLATASSAQAVFSNGETVEITGYVAIETRWDLAIAQLATPPKGVTPLPIASDEPAQAEEVVAVGSPLGEPFIPSKGIVRRTVHTYELETSARAFVAVLGGPPEQVWVEHDARIAPGNSGGPLIDLAGNVIGVNTWVDPDLGVGYALAGKYIAQLLNKRLPKVASLAEFRRDDDLYNAARRNGDGGGIAEEVTPDSLQKQFDTAAARHWRVQDPAEYAELQQFARALIVAKQSEGRGSLREAAKYSDVILGKLAAIPWDTDHKTKGINQFAKRALGLGGVAIFCIADVVNTTRFDQGELVLLRLSGNAELIATAPLITGPALKPGAKCLILGAFTGQLQTPDGEVLHYLPNRLIIPLTSK